MRNDLTAGFIAAMEDDNRTPIQLIVFHFPSIEIGDVFLSDRDVTIGGQDYRGLIENWGEISTSGQGVSDIIAETLEMTISIWDGGAAPFSNYFLIDEPTNIFVDIYQTFDGLAEEDKALIGSFVIQDPIEWSESSRLLALDLVSVNMRYTANVGELVTKDLWPNAPSESIGKGYDVLLGNAGTIELIPVVSPLITSTRGDQRPSYTLLVSDDLDDQGWPEFGQFRIGARTSKYQSRSSNTFYCSSGVSDGGGTIYSNETVTQVLDKYEYVVGQGPITDIIDITVNNSDYGRSGALWYKDFSADLVTIYTDNEPYFIAIPDDEITARIEFDSILAENTAINTAAVFETNFEYATITKANPTLSIFHDIPDDEFYETGDFWYSNVMIEIEANEDVGDFDLLVNIQVPEILIYDPSTGRIGVWGYTSLGSGVRNYKRISLTNYPVRDSPVRIIYSGDSDTIEIKVYRIWFEGYLKESDEYNGVKEYSNIITCKVLGSPNNRPDEVIQYLLNERAGLPLENMGSIWAQPATWDDTDIWNDTDIWIDGGNQLPYPEGAAFQEAAARYAYLGYTLNGVISAGDAIEDAIKEICKQARGSLIWSEGKAKLAVREISEEWVSLKNIDKQDLQFKSLSIQKDVTDNIYNEINIFYDIDNSSELSGVAQYNASVNVIDSSSVTLNGTKKDDSEWLFYLVNDSSMAQDLADYYIWRYGMPATKYIFNTYLPQFDLEKGDTVRLSSDFSRLNNLPLRLIENVRSFGSGKTSKINTIQLLGESIRHKLHLQVLEDNFLVVDDITISSSGDLDSNDSAAIVEQLAIEQTTEPADVSSVSDAVGLTAIFSRKQTDSAMATDTIAAFQSFSLGDSISLVESFYVSYEPCFGACGFGGQLIDGVCNLPFGAVNSWESNPTSETVLTETLVISTGFNINLSDTISIIDDIDVSELLKDIVAFDEELIFNSCFGCPVVGATGFGLNNFGS